MEEEAAAAASATDKQSADRGSPGASFLAAFRSLAPAWASPEQTREAPRSTRGGRAREEERFLTFPSFSSSSPSSSSSEAKPAARDSQRRFPPDTPAEAAAFAHAFQHALSLGLREHSSSSIERSSSAGGEEAEELEE